MEDFRVTLSIVGTVPMCIISSNPIKWSANLFIPVVLRISLPPKAAIASLSNFVNNLFSKPKASLGSYRLNLIHLTEDGPLQILRQLSVSPEYTLQQKKLPQAHADSPYMI